MKRVFLYSKSSGTARTIFLALAEHANHNDEAWPSAARLASYANVSRRHVFSHLQTLINLDEIECVGEGVRGVKKYKITLSDGDQTVTSQTGDDIVTGDETVTPTGDETVTSTGDETVTRTITKPPLEPSIERFEEFYSSVYPKRTPHQNPKKPAKESFLRSIKKGCDPDEIIQGTKLFADRVKAEKTDPKFIPQAVTFLNQERWRDELAEPRKVATKW